MHTPEILSRKSAKPVQGFRQKKKNKQSSSQDQCKTRLWRWEHNYSPQRDRVKRDCDQIQTHNNSVWKTYLSKMGQLANQLHSMRDKRDCDPVHTRTRNSDSKTRWSKGDLAATSATVDAKNIYRQKMHELQTKQIFKKTRLSISACSQSSDLNS